MGLGSSFKKAIKKVSKGISEALKKAAHGMKVSVSDAWHKSGMDDNWQYVSLISPLTAPIGAAKIAGDTMSSIADKLTPDISLASSEALSTGTNVDQSDVTGDSISNLRKRLAARKTVSSTKHSSLG